MPKMFVHTRQGTFTPEARAQVASALTDLGIACERLPNTAKIRSGVWVFFTEHAPDAIFRAGEIAPDPPPISLIALSLEGGFDAASKQRMIADATAILRKHAGLNGDQAPVYVVIRVAPEENWGMYGKQVSLAAMRASG